MSRLVIAYSFMPRIVRRVVGERRVGAYVLGHCHGDFVPGYVGRSDYSLRERLADHPLSGQFDYFVLRYTLDSASAYAAECELWHGCTQAGRRIENRIHPASPREAGLVCPYCEFADQIVDLWNRRLNTGGSSRTTCAERSVTNHTGHHNPGEHFYGTESLT